LIERGLTVARAAFPPVNHAAIQNVAAPLSDDKSDTFQEKFYDGNYTKMIAFMRS
jgi:hypothetical protein